MSSGETSNNKNEHKPSRTIMKACQISEAYCIVIRKGNVRDTAIHKSNCLPLSKTTRFSSYAIGF